MPAAPTDTAGPHRRSAPPRPKRGRRRAPQPKRTGRRITGVVVLLAVLVVAGTALAVLHNRPSKAAVAAAKASRSEAAAASAAAQASAADTLTGVGGVSGVFPLSSVQAAAPDTTLTLAQLTNSGLQRSYLVVAPKTADDPLPLIVVLHGQAAAATQEALRTELLPLANAGKAILVYPAGYLQSWNVEALSCCGQAGTLPTNDAAFIASVVGAVKGQFSIASHQVFLVGYSNGGKMAYDVMCRYPQLFHAFAAVSATPLAACSITSPPPASALIITGSADPELPIASAAQDAATVQAAAAAVWRKNDSCSVNSQSSVQGIATVTTWGACANSTQVQTALYAGGTHGWPVAIPASNTPSAATLIWNFFSSLG